MLGRARYAALLEDLDVRRWYENVARGSPVTADVYLRRLGSTCRRLGLEPKGLAGMGEDRLYGVLLDLVSALEREGKAGSYIEGVVKAIRSWLMYRGVHIRRKIKIRGARDAPTLRDERVPTRDELRRILLSGDRRARLACALLAYSGLRVEVLGNYRGTDGLRLRDLPELRIAVQGGCGADGGGIGSGGGTGSGTRTGTGAGRGAARDGPLVTFEKIPTLLVVRKELSKAGHQYFTFLGREGCEYLRDYLEERVRLGESLNPDSPLITPKWSEKPFIRSINISDLVRLAIRGAGLPWRPYVLRSYFDTQLMLAESKGLVLRDYRTFWMGHKGDIENRYTTNKCRLPEGVVEDMREAYSKGARYLEAGMGAGSVGTGEEELRVSFRRQLLLVAGARPEEVERMDLASMGDSEFRDAVRKRLLGVMMNNGARQRVVPVGEIEEYISQGWEFVSLIPGERAIMRLPV
jgi:integrase